MGAPFLELEGSWEEIRAHDAELAGRRVSLRVLEPNPDNGREVHPNDALIDVLRETEVIQYGMGTSPARDTVQLNREGRAGAMYGNDVSD